MEGSQEERPGWGVESIQERSGRRKAQKGALAALLNTATRPAERVDRSGLQFAADEGQPAHKALVQTSALATPWHSVPPPSPPAPVVVHCPPTAVAYEGFFLVRLNFLRRLPREAIDVEFRHGVHPSPRISRDKTETLPGCGKLLVLGQRKNIGISSVFWPPFCNANCSSPQSWLVSQGPKLVSRQTPPHLTFVYTFSSSKHLSSLTACPSKGQHLLRFLGQQECAQSLWVSNY